MWCHMSCDVTWHMTTSISAHFRWFHLYHVISFVMWCHGCHVVSCDVMGVVSHVMSCDVWVSCGVMLCHVMSWCHVMSGCHVMSCGVMWCHVMSCDVKLLWLSVSNQSNLAAYQTLYYTVCPSSLPPNEKIRKISGFVHILHGLSWSLKYNWWSLVLAERDPTQWVTLYNILHCRPAFQQGDVVHW